ncbi:Protein MEI2-like 4 [Linum grandiflorum]
MPFEIMDQRGVTAASHFFEDICLPAERQVGFRKPYTMTDHQGGHQTVPIPGNKFVASSPFDSLSPASALSMELPRSIVTRPSNEKINNGEGTSKAGWNSVDHHPKSWSSLTAHPAAHSLGRNGTTITGTEWESSLFSSSFSEIFNRKVRLTGNDIQSREPTKIAVSALEEEPFESLEEIEAQTIGNLLPADDDLFSGITNDLGNIVNGTAGDDLEDFDLFSSGGGMELEGDIIAGRKNPDLFALSSGSITSKHPFGELPSRTLFVRNINSNVEDSELKTLFEQYGEIRTLYTTCKHRGFVMISYYDIRAAQNAMQSLQHKPLRRRKLDIHFSIPKENPSEKDVNQGILTVLNLDSSVSTEELHQIFAAYGEIKEVHGNPNKHNHILIEYYDVRSVEAALNALDRTEIAGKQIKLEAGTMGAARRSVQRPDQGQDETSLGSQIDDLSSMQMAAFSPGVMTSSCMDGIPSQVAHSPMSAFMDPHRSSSVPNHLRSRETAALVAKQQFSHPDHQRSIQEIRYSNQSMSTFHPHSLPEYHDGLSNGIPYNSASTLGGMAGSVGSQVMEGINGRHGRGVSSNVHMMELNSRGSFGFGSPGNGSTLPGHYSWNNSTSVHQKPANHMMWPNSGSFVNGIRAHPLSHLNGLPRAPTTMLNRGPAPHHVGSAPSVNPSLWDCQHSYSGESPDPSSFHLGSLGSMGFASNSPPPHPMENIFPHVNGNCVDITKSAGIRSPQQMCHLFPARNQMVSMPSSFDSPNDRVRSLSHRRMESNSNQSDKKQFELDVERIARGEDSRTTLMIKNIPNKYTSKMLLAAIDEYCRGSYDFLYLPIDFKNKCNVGYAFINMTDPQQIIPFHKAFNGKKWEKFNSEKVASLAYARIQGKSALISHFQNSSLMNEDKRCRPILFHTEGPNAGDPEPFPMGTNIRSRMGRPRTNGHDGNRPSAANMEDCLNGTDTSSNSD